MREKNNPVERPTLELSIDSPTNGATVTGPATGQLLVVNGSAGGNRVNLDTLEVTINYDGATGPVKATIVKDQTTNDVSWVAELKLSVPGDKFNLQAVGTAQSRPPGITGKLRTVETIQVNVSDTVAPHDVQVLDPAGPSVSIGEDVTEVPLKVRAVDFLTVRQVECAVDHTPIVPTLERDPSNRSVWTGKMPVSILPLGAHTLTVRATDLAGNSTQISMNFSAVDNTPPHYEIVTPAEGERIMWSGAGTTVRLSGTARDKQSGVARVEWSTDGVHFVPAHLVPAQTVNDWANWSADVPVPDFGFYEILVRFTDASENHTTGSRNFEAVSTFKPKDMEELLSPRAYLDALLAFVRDHVHDAAGAAIATDDLEAAFFQPFGKLKEPLSEVGNAPVNRLRVPLEALRAYQATRPALLAGHWRCDEPRGVVLGDDSPFGNNGALVNGASLAIVGGRQAVSFNGDQARAQISNALPLEVGKDNADFSVAFWLYLRQGFTGRWRAIMHKGSVDTERTFAMWMRPNNNSIHYRISTTKNLNDGGDRSSAEIPLNTWTHIAYIKNGRLLKLYVNGILDSSVTLTSDSSSNSGPVYLGSDPWAAGINGALTDIRIYQMALTEDTVQALVKADPSTASTPTEEDYRLIAYTSLLRSLGASYEEIRLAPGMADAERKALADRLGVSLGSSRPDALDALLVPSPLTETWLEQVFGLPDTNRRLASPPAARPLLLDWQFSHLKEQWMRENHSVPASETPGRLIVDPDLIGEPDLRNPVAGNLAFNLWQSRKAWVETVYTNLKNTREAQVIPLAGLDRIVSDTLGAGVDLRALEVSYRAGQDIRPILNGLQLSLNAFLYLIRLRALAQAGTVTNIEWSNLYSILTQVRKLRMIATWRTEEQTLSLSPEHFRLAATSPLLPAWRATGRERLAWQDLLRARIAEQNSLEEGLQSAVRAAEQVALPVLRDAILVALAGPDAAEQAGDRLVEYLLIDVKDNGAQQTTRNLQAAETLQQALFAIRTLALTPEHPAFGWMRVEEGKDDGEKDENFDQEVRWISSIENWRAITQVFLYPENHLLSGIRPVSQMSDADQTLLMSAAYQTLLNSLRQTPILTPKQARRAASEYLAQVGASVPGLPADFTLTDQLSKLDLVKLGDLHPERWGADRNLISEIFYFVPMELALRLQKSGQYLAALGWYRTVYAYDLPPEDEKRKVSYILRQEKNAAPQINRNAHWLRKATNPHTIAASRPNPYTRYALMSSARCMVEFADSEYAGEALGNARSLYQTARTLLSLPELDLIQPTSVDQALLPNPVLDGLRLRVATQLAKLRQGRNIAGVVRQVDLPSSDAAKKPQTAAAPSAPQRPPRPTPYRFSVLMERSKQLVNIAQQIEAAYLGTLKDASSEKYGQFKAGQDLNLAEAGVKLHGVRVTEAVSGEAVAKLQRQRAELQEQHYEDLLIAGVSQLEQASLSALSTSKDLTIGAAVVNGVSAIAGLIGGAIGGYAYGGAAGSAAAGVGGAILGALSNLSGVANVLQNISSSESTRSQMLSMLAGFERRRQEWGLQMKLAMADGNIGRLQENLTKAHSAVVRQEEAIARMQADQAQAMVDFLANKFLNTELFEWMSDVLGGVYRFFLQQATAIARVAEMQLNFERQVAPRTFIQADYWEAPAEGGTVAAPQTGTPDRRGLTGSARLLQDIYQLDQYAFETDKRKLNLVQIFSLAQLAPFEFQRFRQTGSLPFATPMSLFDQAFPGHYLRLIKRVRTTVIALIPPNQGIRATLMASGLSRVVAGGDRFEEVVIHRDPELVALTSPANSTGVFDLDAQSEMLFPFESMGVDTTWEFQMPKAANPFDFNTVVDVLLTVEYTAINSFDYREHVIRNLDPTFTANRVVSFRDQLPDAWYDLHNPNDPQAPLTVTFETARADFPPNLQNVAIQQVLLHMVHSEDEDGEVSWDDEQLRTGLSLTLTTDEAPKPILEAQPEDGTISTRRGNGVPWRPLIEKAPVGKWTFTMPKEAIAYFQSEKIEDILFIITYTGRTPPWPA